MYVCMYIYIYICICYPPSVIYSFVAFQGVRQRIQRILHWRSADMEQVKWEDAKFELAACPLRVLDPFRLAAMLSMYWVRRWPVLARMSLPAAKTHAACPLRGLGLLVP